MQTILKPKIEMFSPFKKPFANESTENELSCCEMVIVSPEIIEYMKNDNTKIVAKCTPCQCCACR